MSEHVQPLEATRSAGTSQETQKVIFASSLGTVFELSLIHISEPTRPY